MKSVLVFLLLALGYVQSQNCSVLFVSMVDPRHLGPMQIIWEEFTTTHYSSCLLLSNGSFFEKPHQSPTKSYTIEKDTQAWIPGLGSSFLVETKSQAALVKKLIKDHSVKVTVVDMMCIGGYLASQEVGVTTIKQLPFPYTDIVGDPYWMPAFGSSKTINMGYLESITNYFFRLFQYFSIQFLTWNLGFQKANYFEGVHIVNAVIGYEYPRYFGSNIIFIGPILPPLSPVPNGIPLNSVIVDLPKNFAANINRIISNMSLVDGYNIVYVEENSETDYFVNSNVVGVILLPEYLKIQRALQQGLPILAISNNSHFEQGNRLSYSKAGSFMQINTLTSESFQEFFYQLKNGSFFEKAKQQKTLIQMSGGSKAAVKHIVAAYNFGNSYILPIRVEFPWLKMVFIFVGFTFICKKLKIVVF